VINLELASITWESITAISTLALAAVTVGLAASTRRLAREAASERRANWRPVLMIESRLDPSVDGSAAVRFRDRTLSLRITNVGRGPALLVRCAIAADESERHAPTVRGKLPGDVAAPGGVLVARWPDFEPPRNEEAGLRGSVWSTIAGEITYGDVAYHGYVTAFKIGVRVDGEAALLDQIQSERQFDRLRRATIAAWWFREQRANLKRRLRAGRRHQLPPSDVM